MLKQVGRLFQYLLPALIPSWRFFDYIGPSPRMQFAIVAKPDDPVPCWQEFRPRPAHLPFAFMLWRLFWNPQWNETLYMVSCAEKLFEKPSAMREEELLTRIAAAIARGEFADTVAGPAFLLLRIVVVKRVGEQIVQQVSFVSSARRLDGAGESAAT